jgi:3-hydroxyisobutyrate dehydrogenase
MTGRVGFIGLGAMGRPMALNLVKSGFSLVVHDIDPAKVEPLRAKGAEVVDSPEKVAAAADRTISIVETTAQAVEVITGARGIIRSAPRGHVVISMSTIDPFVAQRLARELAAQGIAMLDAPVSGGTTRAETGELSIIVGGDADTFEACRDVFKGMGTGIFHVGDVGKGLAMKLVNNMLIQVNLVAIAEALVMGVKAGLDPQTIYDVVRVSTGTSAAWESKVPQILARDFAPGGTMDIYYKDQELETAFAKQLGVPVFLANVSQQVYQMARAAGLNKEDGTAVIKVFERMAGVTVTAGETPTR